MRLRTLVSCGAMALGFAAPAAFAQDYGRTSPAPPAWADRDASRDIHREEWRDRDNRRDRDEWREERRDARRDADTARVVASRPIYGRDTRQECFNPRTGAYEEVREENRARIGKGAAIGAVAGGILGHQIDRGGGTAAGALLGGLLGHQLQKRNASDPQDDLDLSRCRVASGADRGRVDGYAVRYEYEGREYVTQLEREPGDRLVLGRDVRRDGTPFDNVAEDLDRAGYARR